MTRTRQPALHFPYPATPANLRHASRVLDHLASAGRWPAAPAALIAGAHGAADLTLSIAPDDHSALVAWIDTLAPTGSSALCALRTDQLDADPSLARDLPLIAGLGLVTASAGTSAAPLRSLALPALRRALRASRERLEDACGHPVTTLHLIPDARGLSLDALIITEARAAGYTNLRAPSRGPDQALALLRGLDTRDVTWTRHLSVDDRAPALIRWATDAGT